MADTRHRALIADRDAGTRISISRHLSSEGFDITECTEGRDALERVSTMPFDLIVVDASLDALDGIALCRAIRHGTTNRQSAVFVVASSDAEADKVLAFVNGADDYMIKPLREREFVARVSAIMRRVERGAHQTLQRRIDRSEMQLDPAKRQVIVRGRVVACTKQEFDLLYALASSPGVVFSREALLTRHWPASAASPLGRGRSESAIRLVDPIVSRIRRKIEKHPDAPRMILTVWGVGYKFSESEI